MVSENGDFQLFGFFMLLIRGKINGVGAAQYHEISIIGVGWGGMVGGGEDVLLGVGISITLFVFYGLKYSAN